MKTLKAMVASSIVAATLLVPTSAQASFVEIPVTPGGDPTRYTLAALSVRATAVNPALVRMDTLSYTVSDWAGVTPTNVGVTTYMLCEGDVSPVRPYYGENIVKNGTINVAIRLLISVPGDYFCTIEAAAYSSASVPGMTVSADTTDMRFWSSGAYAQAEQWGGTVDDNLNTGDGFLRYSRDFFGLPDKNIQLLVDTALTNCFGPEEDGICDGWQPYGTAGNSLRVYASLLPINDDGSKCANELLRISDFTLTDAQHHKTVILTLAVALPEECPGVRARVGYRMFSGDATQLHGASLRSTRLILVP